MLKQVQHDERRDCFVPFTVTPIWTIWTSASVMKVPVIMVSRTSKTKLRAIPVADFVADIERRRRETGITELPRNSGKRRTESKKALLKAIEDAGGKW